MPTRSATAQAAPSARPTTRGLGWRRSILRAARAAALLVGLALQSPIGAAYGQPAETEGGGRRADDGRATTVGRGGETGEAGGGTAAGGLGPAAGQVAASARGPRGLLELLGTPPERLNALEDDLPVEQLDQQALERMLYRLSRFEPEDYRRWMVPDLPMDELAAYPERYRGSLILLRGSLEDWRAIPATDEAKRLFGFQHVYYVWVRALDPPRRCLVVTPHIPRQWGAGAGNPRGAPAAWQALFYQWAEGEEGRLPVWLATHTAWYPDRVDASLGITGDHVLLASLDVDIGRLQDAPARGPLTSRDAQGFYAVLGAASRLPEQKVWERARAPEDWVSFLSVPASQIGRLYRCQGTARRAVRIMVPEHAAGPLGADHYYEVEVFVPLPKVVRFVDASDPRNVKTFRDYPIVFCTPRLPPGMPQGENIHQPVRVAGFYYKLWTYRSPYMTGEGAGNGLRQVSPLLVGAAIEPFSVAARPSRSWALASAAAAAVLLAVVVGWAWIWGRADRQALRRLRTWRDRSPGNPSP